MITAQVWDERRCWVGEGPTASGTGNNSIKWVDILNSKVQSKNLVTGNVDEYQVSEHVSFAIPRTSGGEILGTNSGPILRDTNGTIHQLPNRFSADGKMDWSDDGRTMYYVDTMTHSVEITSAHNGNELGTDGAGMTFICTPGVRGRTTTLYPS